MIPNELTQDIKTRLATIKGQVEGIIKMLDSSDNFEKIITQFKAIDGGLDNAKNLFTDEVFRKILALKIVEVAEACPGNCGSEDKIELIRQKFPDLTIDEILKQYKEITEIGKNIMESKKENP